MVSSVSIKALGDWNAQIDVPLQSALMTAIEITGKQGVDACQWAMVLMAKAAAARTKQAKKNRKVLIHKGVSEKTKRAYKLKYVIGYDNQGQESKYYEIQYKPRNPKAEWTWDKIKNVPNRKLAKRSWFWSLSKMKKALGNKFYGKPIDGATALVEDVGTYTCSITLFNRLSYIFKAAPADVAEQAAKSASNQIMAQSAKKMESIFAVEMSRLHKGKPRKPTTTLAKEWKSN